MGESELPWDDMGLSREQQEALRGLGAASVPALLGMILAVPKEFYAFFGEEETRKLQELLDKKLTAEERSMFTEPCASPGGMGALMNPCRGRIT